MNFQVSLNAKAAESKKLNAAFIQITAILKVWRPMNCILNPLTNDIVSMTLL
jgi:hypothetical protein